MNNSGGFQLQQLSSNHYWPLGQLSYQLLAVSLSCSQSEHRLLHNCSRYTTVHARGVVPLRHLRHMPPSPDSMATLVNSLQNQVNSITPCITLNANTGKIVLVTLCIQIEWLFY